VASDLVLRPLLGNDLRALPADGARFLFVAPPVTGSTLLHQLADARKRKSHRERLSPATWPVVRETSSDAVGSSAAGIAACGQHGSRRGESALRRSRLRKGATPRRLRRSRLCGGRFTPTSAASSPTPRLPVSMTALAAMPVVASAPQGCASGRNARRTARTLRTPAFVPARIRRAEPGVR
jgi:hypothetical protein